MHRIYVTYTIPDARANSKKKQFTGLGLKNNIGAVRVVDCYTIDAKLDQKQIQKAKMLLANPLMQETSVVSPFMGSKKTADKSANYAPKKFHSAIEIGFLPGVTDNVASTAKETLSDGAKVKFKPGQNAYSSQVFFISGNLSPADVKKIADSLYNPLIQRASIKSREQFVKDGGMDVIAPKVKLTASNKVSRVDLNVSDDELVKLGKFGIPDSVIARSASDEAILSKKRLPCSPKGSLAMTKRRGPLALGLDELKTIRDYFRKFKRQPTDIELETLAQTWSEHCKHTIFADPMDELEKGIYKTYIKGATEKIRKAKGRKDFCVSVFTDNAGGIVFDQDYIVSHKVETHNTPSALDPFGGSVTGIVGVNRDVLGFGLGAKPIANFFGFCLAEPGDKTKLFRDKEQKNPMLSARRIMDGVISGINAGGNQSGIPTPLGFLNFNPRYRGKPLVFAGTVGLSPKKNGSRLSWQKQAKPGDLIVVVGGRVGADGIHGATFSSEGLDKDSPATAVQIGDPITQKKLSDAIVKEARRENLYNSITDCGAGGLSSAIGEMASQSKGCEVTLDKVPLKYPGLAPWQIWISESQERMILSVPKNKWAKFLQLMNKRGVEATAIGTFTKSGSCVVKYNGKTVLNMEMEFLHNGRPKHKLITKKPKLKTKNSPVPKSLNLKSLIFNLLSQPNVTSTEFVNTQYDHEVQASSVLKPLQGAGKINSEAAVISPVLTSKKALVLSYGLNPALSEIDPYNMAASSIDSAVRSAVAAGANVDYLALLDNFCWCSPEDPKRLWQLKEAARACYDLATAYGTPFISGKDSMYNDFKGFSGNGEKIKISIPPTLLISTLSVIPDAAKTVSLDAKLPGDLLYILGSTNNELGGSEFIQMQSPLLFKEGWPAKRDGVVGVPKVDAQKNYKLYKTFFTAVQKNLVASSISISRGGLSVALIKTLIGGGLGAEINLAGVPGNWKENYEALFSESQGRILASVAPQNSSAFERLIKGQAFAKIGRVISKKTVTITNNNSTVVNLKTDQALKAYKSTFKDF